MKHQYDYMKNTSDCWMDGGQAVSEMLIGTTFTRNIQRGWKKSMGFTCDPACAPTQYCEGSPLNVALGILSFGGSRYSDAKCHDKKDVGEKVGPSAEWKCLTGKEVFGTCHNGPGSLDDGVEVGFDAFTKGAKYCKSGIEDWGKCAECGGPFCSRNDACDKKYGVGKKYCENGKCHDKKEVGVDVGPTAGCKCKTGIEIMGKCVECKDNDNSYCDKIYTPGTKYCEFDKCHDKLDKCQKSGPGAGKWKCKSEMKSLALATMAKVVLMSDVKLDLTPLREEQNIVKLAKKTWVSAQNVKITRIVIAIRYTHPNEIL